jgi:hypothetical protein
MALQGEAASQVSDMKWAQHIGKYTRFPIEFTVARILLHSKLAFRAVS